MDAYGRVTTLWLTVSSGPAEIVGGRAPALKGAARQSFGQPGTRMNGRAPMAATNPSWLGLVTRLCVCLLVWTIIPSEFARGGQTPEIKRVLILHSFGRDFRPWGTYAKAIRENLELLSPWQIDIKDHSLVSARSGDENHGPPFIAYLNALYSEHPPDIVIAIGAPASNFVQHHRRQLFTQIPLILTAVEQRRIQFSDLPDNDTVIAVSHDFRLSAAVAIRILNGEKPRDIRPAAIKYANPKFDWREMQRWGISESNLLPGSEILFREPRIWDIYRWQLFLIATVVLTQGALISGLLHERRRRRLAEVESRQRLTDLAHINRSSTVGELTISIAHELNQPLGSILTNTETAELMLKSPSPNLDEVKEILADIRRDDQRASEVIRRLRSVLKKTPFEITCIDLNETVRQVIGFIATVGSERNIALKCSTDSVDLKIMGDVVHLQQVFLNLMINAMDAISEAEAIEREVSVTTRRSGAWAEVNISDTGPGIAISDLEKVFDPFFTTKPQGMGMGLAIVRSIVEAHHGRISAANQSPGGALFTLRLPIPRDQATSV